VNRETTSASIRITRQRIARRISSSILNRRRLRRTDSRRNFIAAQSSTLNRRRFSR